FRLGFHAEGGDRHGGSGPARTGEHRRTTQDDAPEGDGGKNGPEEPVLRDRRCRLDGDEIHGGLPRHPRRGARASHLALTMQNEMRGPSRTSHPLDAERSPRPTHPPLCSVVGPALLAPPRVLIHSSPSEAGCREGMDAFTTVDGAVPSGEPVAGGRLPPRAVGAERVARIAPG